MTDNSWLVGVFGITFSLMLVSIGYMFMKGME